MIAQAFLVGPIIQYFGNDDAYILVLSMFLFFITSLHEQFATSMQLYIIFSMIPNELINSTYETAAKTWLLSNVPASFTGTVFSSLNLVMAGVGILSPIYATTIFTYYGGAKNKGWVSTVHYLVLSVIGYGLYKYSDNGNAGRVDSMPDLSSMVHQNVDEKDGKSKNSNDKDSNSNVEQKKNSKVKIS